jgi:hypothetical protein
MAVDTGPADQEPACIAGKTVPAGIRNIGMGQGKTCLMATLAELRGLPYQQLVMVRPMRLMTVQTVFNNRRMFKPEGPPFVCMALIAKFIDGIGPDHLLAESAMRVMAV